MRQSNIEDQIEVIKRGAVEIIAVEELRKKLTASAAHNKPLVVKAGFDPTAPDIHLGHTVLLRKMRQFQDLGHKVYFLIGDFTAQIGDPTGKSQLRKQLNKQEVLQNAATYKEQISKVLRLDTLNVVFNSSWLETMKIGDFLGLTMHTTVAQMLTRADFKQRYAQQQDISLLEFMYPLLQAYDSVHLQADIEIGGSDQIFNLLKGREMQKDFSQEPQVVMTMPLLEGIDGVQKMSKSYGNYIGINEPAKDIFGKIMSLSDELMFKYYTLLTDVDLPPVKNLHPKEAKLNLASNIVGQYYGKEKALEERAEFERVFSRQDIPQETAVYAIAAGKSKSLMEILVESRTIPSRNEARRLLQQGAVTFNGEKIDQETAVIEKAGVLKIGKRRFLRIEVG